MLKPKSAMRSIPAYAPPVRVANGLLCDMNENLAGCSPRVLARIHAITTSEVATYPDRLEGERCVAEFLQLHPDRVLLTNGVDEGIHLLCETFIDRGAEALIVTPTFGMYEVFAAAAGATVIKAQLREDFSFPLEKVLHSIRENTRFIALASPNNPTGAVIARDDLLAVAAAAPQAAVLVDEAYVDFYGKSVLDALAVFPNLFVTRTFSKAYGLAGLRIGALLGDAVNLGSVRRLASPYNVNAVALACLPAALDDVEFIAESVRQVNEGRARISQELQKMGLQFWPSTANFVLVRVGGHVQDFVAALAENGVLVRCRDGDPGCAGCVRITVGPAAVVDKVLSALRLVLGAAAEVGG